MDNQKNTKKLYIVIGLLCILSLLLGGYIIYEKLSSNSSNDFNTSANNNQSKENENVNTNEDTNNSNHTKENNTNDEITNSNESKENLTSTELNELNTFLNELLNSQMANVIFENPSELLKNNKENNYSYLTYIISRSKYAEHINDEHIPKYSITLSGIKSTLQELTNNNYSEDEIKQYFNSLYHAETDTFIILGGGAGRAGPITNSYKKGNYYYITLSNKANVVLIKINGSYYFYSNTITASK